MSEDGIIKRSVMIAGHRTSVSLEAPFWRALQGLATRGGQSVAALIASVDAGRKGGNLSSSLRIVILEDALARTGAGPALSPPGGALVHSPASDG